jgi:hypothetical protein
LEVLEADDDTVRADMRHRIALSLLYERNQKTLAQTWSGLDVATRGRLWRGVHKAVGDPVDNPPADPGEVAEALLRIAPRLCTLVLRTRRRATPGRSRKDLRAMQQSARMIGAGAQVQLAETAERKLEIVERALAKLPPEPAWQARYNAACLICRALESARVDDARAQRLLRWGLEHIVGVMTDPAWRHVSPALAEERRQWLFDGDPDLAALRGDAGDAGEDFRHLRARHCPGAIEVHVLSGTEPRAAELTT